MEGSNEILDAIPIISGFGGIEMVKIVGERVKPTIIREHNSDEEDFVSLSDLAILELQAYQT